MITLAKETLDDAIVVRCSGRMVAGTTEVLHAEIKRLIVPGGRVPALCELCVIARDCIGVQTLITGQVSCKTLAVFDPVINRR